MLISLLVVPRCADAQTTLLTSGTWNVPGNWSNGLPTSSISATVDNSCTVFAPTGISGSTSTLYIAISGTGALTVNGGNVTGSNSFLGLNAGSNGMATITGGKWATNYGLFVGFFGTGTLSLSGTGLVTSGSAVLGVNPGSNGTATVTSGTWTNSGNFVIGSSGTGTLNINGGSVTSGTAFIGRNGGSNGTVTVTSGTWTNSGILYVGPSGTGTLNIQGGVVSSGGSDIGQALGGGGGTVTITSGTWNNSAELDIGFSGMGTLNIQGGAVTSGSSYLGWTAGSNGTATITSGTWNTSVMLSIGSSGTGTLNINGGTVTDTVGSIGASAGSCGTVTITSGTWTNNSNSLVVGQSGAGTLNINGGLVTNLTGYIGINASSNGTATVTSGTWTNAGDLYVSYSGTSRGILNLNGGTVTNLNGYLGYNAKSSGTATVSSGKWTNTGGLYVGNSGTGTLNIQGGTVTSGSGIIGSGTASNGTATVTSGTWTNSGALIVGNTGTGTLNIQGGTVTSGNGIIGYGTGSSGTATVSNGKWANSSSSSLTVGNSGTGTLYISGGLVTSGTGYIGSNAGSNGTATITSGTWNNSNSLNIGNSGTGTLNINGGYVTNGSGYIGYNAGSNGTATITSGTWSNSIALCVGTSGTGTLFVNDGLVTSGSSILGRFAGSNGMATVSSGTWNNSFSLTAGNGGMGILNLSDSGVIAIASGTGILTLASGTGSIGTLNLGGTSGATTVGTLKAAVVTGGSGSATVNFNHTGSYTFAPNLTGTMTVNKLGAGTTILTGSSTYTGSTNINAGTLIVNGVLGNTTVVVGNSVTAGLTPTLSGGISSGALTTPDNTSNSFYTPSAAADAIGGSVTISGPGSGSAGNLFGATDSVSTLKVGNLTLNTGSISNWQFGGTANSFVSVAGTLTLSGSNIGINLYNEGLQTALVKNGTYDLFQYGTLSGAVSNLSVLNPNGLHTYTFSTSASGNYLTLTVGDAVTNSQYSLVATATTTRIVTGGTTGVTVTILNSGTGTQDSISFTGLSATGTTINGSSVSGTTLAQGMSGSNTGLTFSNTTPGTYTITPTVGAVTNGTATGTPAAAQTTGTTINVVAQRTITDGAVVDFGTLHSGAAVSGTSTFTTSGLNETTTSVSVAAASGTADANGVMLTGSANAFDGSAVTQSSSRVLSGTISTIGALSGSFGLGVTTLENGGAGIPGERTYSKVTVGYTANVYSGLMIWNGATNTSWATGSNWTDSVSGGAQAAPGLDASFTQNDTATFGASGVSNLTVNLDGSNPYLKAITFNGEGSYTIAQGSGGALALSNGTDAATISVTGTQTISAPITMASDVGITTVSASDSLLLSGNLSGTKGLTTNGLGTATLSGSNAYTGPTTITGGALVLSGTANISSSSGILVSGSGAKFVQASSVAGATAITLTQGTLDGTGTVGAVTVGDGTGSIVTHGIGGTAPLTLASLTFDGASTVNINTSGDAGIVVSGALTTGAVNASGLITINAASSAWTTDTTYNLIDYGSLGGQGASSFVKGDISGLGIRQFASLANSGSAITLAVVGDTPLWTGAQNGLWTTATIGGASNWKLEKGSTATDFLTGDAVVFDDTASGTTDIKIADANASPASVTFNNGAKNYSITSDNGYGIATGSLVKSGTGSLTIATANTYGGGTTLNAGQLNINNASALGTGTFTINGGSIDNTSGAAIALAGNSAQNWNGDFTFIGSNALDTGTGAVTLNANRTVTVSGSAFTVGGAIGDGGNGYSLTKSGSGTMILTGSSTYTGATNIQAGTLQTGVTKALSTQTAVAVGTGATFDLNSFDQSIGSLAGSGSVSLGSATLTTGNDNTSTTFSGVISGTGGVTKVGTGTWTLAGNNTFTGATNIQAGTLKTGVTNALSTQTAVTVSTGATFNLNSFNQSIGSLAGSGSVTLGSAILTTGNDNTSTTFSGVISGTGGVTKSGSGTLNLTGSNTYSGRTTINNGELLVNGSIAGDVTVAGGMLGGCGRIGGNVLNQAQISPGNSPGTLTIAGNYTQTSTGTVLVQIESLTVYDKLVIGGKATLDGTLQVVYLNGFTPKKGDTFTYITAPGGVTGTFATVETDTLIKLQAQYLPTDGILGIPDPEVVILTAYQGSFAEVKGLTPNQRSVAKGLDKIVNAPRVSHLVTYLDSIVVTEIPQKLELLVPTDLATLFDASIASSQVQALNLERRMEEIRSGAIGFSAAGLNLSDSHGIRSFNGDADGKQPIGKDGKELAPSPINDRWGFFINGSGEFVDEASTAIARGTNFTTGGITTGADYRLGDHVAVGMTAGYANTSANGRGDGPVKIDSGKLALYSTVFNGGYFLNTVVGGGLNDYSTQRETLGGQARGDANGSDFNALLGTGYTYRKGGLSAGPIASVRYTWAGIDSFTERGSLAPLNINDQSDTSLKSTVGWQTSCAFHLGKITVTPQIRTQWQHEYLNNTQGISASFLPGGAFTVYGPEIGRDSLLLDVGTSVQLTQTVGIYLFYSGDLGGENYTSHAVNGGVQLSF